MPLRIDVVLDCADAETLAAFWVDALGYRRFGVAGNYRSLIPHSGEAGPKLILQEVSEAKVGKNRMHIDLVVRDVETEIVRLEQLGAHRKASQLIFEHETEWVVMADPEGNEFCICKA
jgi:predicted enzyme related to lactoylglutathione lyase